MKKLFFLAMTAATLSMASCGGKTAATSNPDSLSVEAVVEAATPAEAAAQIVELLQNQLKNANVEKIKAIGATIAEKVAEFVANGDNEAVQTYTAVINNFVAENAERLKEIGASTIISDALTSISGLPANIADAATQAAEGVKTEALTSAITALAAGENVLDAVKAAAGNALSTTISSAVETATDAQNAAAAAKAAVEAAPEAAKEAVKQKAQEATDAATQKATDAANKAIDDAATAAKKKLGL